MGDSVVIATGVLSRDGQQFKAEYQVRRFKPGIKVFCAWCGPQPGDPKHDLADGTLRCQFMENDYATPMNSFQSDDVEVLKSNQRGHFCSCARDSTLI